MWAEGVGPQGALAETPWPGREPAGPKGRGIPERARLPAGGRRVPLGLARGPGPGFRTQPEPVESGLFILGRKAGAGGRRWGVKPFKK